MSLDLSEILWKKRPELKNKPRNSITKMETLKLKEKKICENSGFVISKYNTNSFLSYLNIQ